MLSVYSPKRESLISVTLELTEAGQGFGTQPLSLFTEEEESVSCQLLKFLKFPGMNKKFSFKQPETFCHTNELFTNYISAFLILAFPYGIIV